jgi:uncharacterized membrane protein
VAVRFALLTVSYLWNANIYLVTPGDPNAMSTGAAVASALGFLVVFWLLYDFICRTFGQKKNGDATVGAMVLVLVCIAAYLACHIFPGQALPADGRDDRDVHERQRVLLDHPWPAQGGGFAQGW